MDAVLEKVPPRASVRSLGGPRLPRDDNISALPQQSEGALRLFVRRESGLLLGGEHFVTLQDLIFRRQLVRLAAEDDPVGLFCQRVDERFGVGGDDFEIEQDHVQLLHLRAQLLVGRADESVGRAENVARFRLDAVEALDRFLQVVEIDFGGLSTGVSFGRKSPRSLFTVVMVLFKLVTVPWRLSINLFAFARTGPICPAI